MREADVVVVPPSNPVVSVGTILGVAGVRDALRATTAPVVGLSPIVGGRHVRGMAEQLLHRDRGRGVGRRRRRALRRPHGPAALLDGWLVDTADADLVDRVRGTGMAAAAVPLLMTDLDATAAMARAALDLVGR